MKRSVFYPLVFLAAALRALAAAPPQEAPSKDPLLFPKDSFTVESKTVKTSQGEKKVTYRSYKHLLYVANPVDKEYQSLDVSVPVEVDGVAVDASRAPILFAIGVGGYMSSNNYGRGGMGGRAMAGPPGGPPAGGPQGARGPGGPPGRNSNVSRNTDLALAAGYVLVQPGCRGRDNKAADGANFGKAPAAIVDLKAAVRYLRHNAGLLPGNPEWIVSTGVSAGGALSALLGVSGNSRMYDSYLKEIGAAQAADNIFASADFCPIIDLEHADMAYEWMFGTVPSRSGLQDQELSKQLKEAFAVYQASLKLRGRSGFGTLTADNYAAYLLQTYLFPSAEKSLKALPDDKRKDYLEKNAWMKWDGSRATFSFADYLAHIGRMKNLPAFDDFDARAPEPNLFGNKTTDSRHFTEFSLRHATGNPIARLDEDVPALVNLMNPMYFIGQNNPGIAGHWWIRHGSSDRDTSLPVIINLATSLENRKKDVNTWLYWDAGHGADEDPEEFIAWIGTITGFGGRNQSR